MLCRRLSPCRFHETVIATGTNRYLSLGDFASLRETTARETRALNPRAKLARHSPSPLFVPSASFVVNPTRAIRVPISPWTDKILRPASSRRPGFQTPDQSMLRSTVGRIPPLR